MEEEHTNFSCLVSGGAKRNHFSPRFLLKMATLLLRKFYWPWENSQGGTRVPTSEIQNHQSGNILIKCLFGFFKYQIFFCFTHQFC